MVHEIDLHGHTVDEALRLFVDFYNRHLRNGSQHSIRVIHGYGSSGEGGKIRRKIRLFLEQAGAEMEWRTGEDVEANPGVTIVFPRKPLPEPQTQLASEIQAFCSVPRTESKIAGEFRKHSPREIKQVIRALVRAGELKVILKAVGETYVTVTR
jgi:hypothetical protein